jgi:uncharacterized protein YecE (DUF72 family)
MPPGDFISAYARRFDTVEVDSSFYRTPTKPMVESWSRKTPPGFLFALKVPQVITHEKLLEDCQEELIEFLASVDLLAEKRGPLLLQFPYFNKQKFTRLELFLERLRPFLEGLPRGYEFAVEIRNKGWITAPLLNLLRQHQVALALIDHPWMHGVDELFSRLDPVTAPFTYVRWLGDRYGIEEKTTHWDRTLIDRTREMTLWIPHLRRLLERGVRIYGYFNNHYAGHAPASVELFQKIWNGD